MNVTANTLLRGHNNFIYSKWDNLFINAKESVSTSAFRLWGFQAQCRYYV